MSKRPKGPPASVQDMLGNAGAKPTLTWRGKVYKFGHNVQAAKARLEELIRAHVVREALATRKLVGGTDGQAYYDDVTAKLDAKHYATLRPGWWAVMQDPGAGVPFLMLSLTAPDHPDLTATDVVAMAEEEPEQVERVLSVVAPDFFRHAAEAAKASPELVEEVVRTVSGVLAAALKAPPSSTTSSGSTAA